MGAFEQKSIVFRGRRTFETAWKGDRSSLHESQNTDVVAWGIFNCLKGEQNHSLGDPKQTCDFPVATDQILWEFIWWYFSSSRFESEATVRWQSFREEKQRWFCFHGLVWNSFLCDVFLRETEYSAWNDAGQELISSFGIWLDCVCNLYYYFIYSPGFIISTVLFWASLLFLNMQTSFKVYFVYNFSLLFGIWFW